MRELIDSLQALVSHTASDQSVASESARLVHDRVDWQASLNSIEAITLPIIEAALPDACAVTARIGEPSQAVCAALAKHYEALEWKPLWGEYLEHADTLALAKKFAFTSVVGPGCLVHSDDVYVGFSLQARDIHYPSHAHKAGETYWIIGGNGDWKIDLDPWFPVEPGSVCLHPPYARHAMQTNRQSLLTVWAWWSDIHSEIDIVR